MKRTAVTAALLVMALLVLGQALGADLTCETARARMETERERGDRLPYLAWLKEIDLISVVCENGRETYRTIGYEYHMAFSAMSFRLDVWPDGRAAITVRKTETVIQDNEAPRLTYEGARMLTADELATFRAKFRASGFWTVPPMELKSTCIPNGMTIVEVVVDGRYGSRELTPCDPPAMVDWFKEVTRLHRTLAP